MITNGATEIRERFSSDDAPSHLLDAHKLTPGKAIELLMQYFDNVADDAVAINDLGVLHSKMGHINAALDCYRKAHHLAPHNTNIAKNLADLLFVEFADLYAAMELYLGVLRRAPEDCDSLLAAGHISAAIDQFEDADHFFTRVCQIEPGHPQATVALNHLAKEGRAAGLTAETDAAGVYENLLKTAAGAPEVIELQAFADRHPGFAPVFNDMGVLHSHADNRMMAEDYYRQATQLDPKNTTFLKNLGDHLFVRSGRLTDAAETYLKVLELDGTDTEALYALTLISLKSGDADSAAVFQRRIQELDPAYAHSQGLPARIAKVPSPTDPPIPISGSGTPIELPTTDLMPWTNQPQALGKKKSVTVSVYLLPNPGVIKAGDAHDWFAHLQQRIDALGSASQQHCLHVLVSAQMVQADPDGAASIRNAVGDKRLISAPSNRLCATLSEALASDPNTYFALIRDDVWVHDDWLDQLCAHLKSDVQTAIVGPLCNFAAGSQQIECSEIATKHDFDAYAADLHETYRHRRIATNNLAAGCALLTNQAMASAGLLDEEAPDPEAAIADWCLRARLTGLKVQVAGDTLAFRPTSVPRSNSGNEWMEKKWNRLINSDEGLREAILDLQRIEEVKKSYYSEGLAAALALAVDDRELHEMSTTSLVNLVELSLDARQFETADRYVHALCERNESGRHTAMAGLVQEGLEKVDSSESLAMQALQKTPELPEALNLMGSLAFRENNSDRSNAFFVRAIKADPGCGESYANLATLMWAENMDAAFELYKTAFKLSPHKADIAELFQSATGQLARYDESVLLVLEAIKRYPYIRLLRSLAIEMYLQLGQMQEAMSQVADVLCDFPLDEAFLEPALKIREQIGPLRIDDSAEKKTTLALCMIVKDEASNIAKCLASAVGVVDEIIVVDTGSKDHTPEIAAIMGATVVKYKWKDSFADARNVYLKSANADWVLVLDADEVLSKRDHQSIREQIASNDSDPCAYTITTRNYDTNPTIIGWTANAGEYSKEERGSGWVPTDKVRLFPNDDRLYYSFPVHEMIEPALTKFGYALKRMDIPVHHYGKLNTVKTKQKHDFYYNLGLQKLDETGDNAYALRELAIQAGLLQKYNEALDLWSRFLKIKPNIPEAYINMGTAYFHLGEYESAHQIAKQGYHIAPDFRESQYNYALMAMHVGRLDTALEIGAVLADNYPEYLPGVFLYVCACFAKGEAQKADSHLRALKQSSLGPFLSKSFETFCRGLSLASQLDYVDSINQALA